MATYILLMTLTPEGQVRALEDPNYLLHVESEIDMPSVQTLGVYAVLGQYDFVTLVEGGQQRRDGALLAQTGRQSRRAHHDTACGANGAAGGARRLAVVGGRGSR